MSFFNDAQRDGLLTGRYICSECGGLMEFEDEWEDTLVCPACGHSVDLEHYGMENDEEYDALSDQRSDLRRLIKTISKGEGVLTRALSLFFL